MYHIGQIIPATIRRGFQGSAIAPTWYPLRVRGGSEAKSCAKLQFDGIEVMYPVEKRVRRQHGQRKEIIVACVPGLIYAKFTGSPNWDVLIDRRIITGIFTHGDAPITLPPDVIKAIRGLPMTALQLEEARRQASMIRPGDTVRLIDGPLSGFKVEVTSVQNGRIWWTSLWGKGEADAHTAERLTEGPQERIC